MSDFNGGIYYLEIPEVNFDDYESQEASTTITDDDELVDKIKDAISSNKMVFIKMKWTDTEHETFYSYEGLANIVKDSDFGQDFISFVIPASSQGKIKSFLIYITGSTIEVISMHNN